MFRCIRRMDWVLVTFSLIPSILPLFSPSQSSHQLIHLCCWACASSMALRCSSDGCPITVVLWEDELPQRGRYLGRPVNRIGWNITVIPSDVWHGFLKGDSQKQCTAETRHKWAHRSCWQRKPGTKALFKCKCRKQIMSHSHLNLKYTHPPAGCKKIWENSRVISSTYGSWWSAAWPKRILHKVLTLWFVFTPITGAVSVGLEMERAWADVKNHSRIMVNLSNAVVKFHPMQYKKLFFESKMWCNEAVRGSKKWPWQFVSIYFSLCLPCCPERTIWWD